MVLRVVLAVCLSFSFLNIQGQDSLNVMFFNLLNFPDAGLPNRQDTLKRLLQHYQPDIFMACELTSEAGADLVLNESLNINGISKFERATFVQNQSSGADINNMLFFNSEKFGLKSQNTILTTVRDISEYTLFYKSPNLDSTSDTLFIDLYVTHLKSSQGPNNESLRLSMVNALCNYLGTQPANRNRIFAGDFNLYSNTEPAYTTLLNTCDELFIDPINAFGNWHNNSNYADIHTQSTRTTNFGTGAPGGMDDRFDFILMNANVMDGFGGIDYLDNTYLAYGNDGNHYNQALIPGNTILPDSVLTSIYYMSDHLPVVAELVVDQNYATGNSNTIKSALDWAIFPNPASQQLIVQLQQPVISGEIQIINAVGQIVLAQRVNSERQKRVDTSVLPTGIFTILLKDDEGQFYSKRLIIVE